MASVGKFVASDRRLVRSTSFRRKRVALCDVCMVFENDKSCNSIPATPLKRRRRCADYLYSDGVQRSAIETLPDDILIRILCGVEHHDLKSLFFVSKSIRAAALIARQSHFAYRTPPRMNSRILNAEDFGDHFDEVEAPNAPKQSRIRRFRLDGKKLADISVSLFASDDTAVVGNREIYLMKNTGQPFCNRLKLKARFVG